MLRGRRKVQQWGTFWRTRKTRRSTRRSRALKERVSRRRRGGGICVGGLPPPETTRYSGRASYNSPTVGSGVESRPPTILQYFERKNNAGYCTICNNNNNNNNNNGIIVDNNMIIIIAPLTIVNEDHWGDLECLYKACQAATTDGGLFTDVDERGANELTHSLTWTA